MIGDGQQGSGFPRVFQEPPEELDSDWTHGFLLVAFGQFPQMEWLEASRSYSSVALHLVDRALESGVLWGDAHPALFMCRHALELYLKTAVPDWRELRRKNGHALTPLIEQLKLDLSDRYRPADIEQLCCFLSEFTEIDPNATAFRFPDGAGGSMMNAPCDYEIWVDFRALRMNIKAIFFALDRICLDNMSRDKR